MSRPDDYRGAPPGGYWGPSAVPPGASATGWTPASVGPSGGQAPGAGSGWSAGVTGPGGHPAPGPIGPPDPGRPGNGQPGPGQWGPGQSGPGQPVFAHAAPGQSGPGQPVFAHAVPGPDGRPVARGTIDPATLFGLVIAGLGGLNFAFGFLPQVTSSRIDESLSVYAVGPGYVPILLLIAGLLALAAFLPGSERSRLAVAAVSVGGAVGAVISLGTSSSLELLAAGQVSKGLGAVLLTIFGIIQAVVAIAAYVVGADLRTTVAVATDSRAASVAGVAPQQWGTAAPPGVMAYPPGAAPASPPSGAATGWSPPADDDRPTGPQRVVDPFVTSGGTPVVPSAPAGPSGGGIASAGPSGVGSVGAGSFGAVPAGSGSVPSVPSAQPGPVAGAPAPGHSAVSGWVRPAEGPDRDDRPAGDNRPEWHDRPAASATPPITLAKPADQGSDAADDSGRWAPSVEPGGAVRSSARDEGATEVHRIPPS